MAVYKPSNCRPFLNAVDLTKPQSWQCELNTSNTKVTGYKLKILDSENKIIFEGQEYSNILGGGLNGSVLIQPLLVVDDTTNHRQWESTNCNTIYRGLFIKEDGSVRYKYYQKIADLGNNFDTDISDGNAVEIEAFANLESANDYANQPFKWQVTVAQGQVWGEWDSVQDFYYDVLVTTGQILGSNAERIQSNLSDEIYKDYYIQLLDVDVPRVRISSYDRTFGYIYPQEGFLTDENVKNATRFKIYKDTDDPEYVSAARAVDYAIAKDVQTLNWGAAFGNDAISVGALESSANKYYFNMSVSNVTRGQYKNFNSVGVNLETLFGKDKAPSNIITFNSTRFLFLSQGDDEVHNSPFNATTNSLNGVWVLVGAADFQADENSQSEGVKVTDDAAIGTCVIRWQRPSDANSWANYLGRNWFVRNGILGLDDTDYKDTAAQNIGSDAIEGQGGTLNETALTFYPEKPVTIYPKNGDGQPEDAKGVTDGGFDETTGVIFHNSETRIYLKPFVGLAEGMRVRWSDLNNNRQYFDIGDLDPNYYYCTPLNVSNDYEFGRLMEQGIIGTLYKVYTFFKMSDENPFYGYTEPTLGISISPSPDGVDVYPFINQVHRRSIDVYGTYDQAQHISWKYFRWVLTDLTLGAETDTGAIYNGEITYHFDGLQDTHRYEITLIVEDEMGYVQQVSETFQITLEELGSGEVFPLEVSFDCETQSVDIDFTRNGLVIPYYWNEAADDKGNRAGYVYKDGAVQIPDEETLYYNKVQVRNPLQDPAQEATEYIIMPIAAPETGDLTFNSQHSDISRHFVGELFEVAINISETRRVRIGGLVPPTVLLDSNGDVVPNARRNQMSLNYWVETMQDGKWTYVAGSLLTTLIAFHRAEGGVSFYWRQSLPIVSAYQKAELCEHPGDFDYLPISYYDPKDADQGVLHLVDAEGNLQSLDADKRYYYLTDKEYNCETRPIYSPIGEYYDKCFALMRVKENEEDVEATKGYNVLVNDSDTEASAEEAEREPYAVRCTRDIKYLTLWQDDESYLIQQINGVNCNVKAKQITNNVIASDFNKRKWSDGGSGSEASKLLWVDNCVDEGVEYYKPVDINTYVPYELYNTVSVKSPDEMSQYRVTAGEAEGETSDTGEQNFAVLTEDVGNHDGRQYIAELGTLTFNIAIKNFDSVENNTRRVVELSGICFIKGGKE